MYGLDMINTSVLGALGCDMNTFLRYFPAAETMYSLLVALAIGLILLGWVWNLFKNYGLGLGIEAEDPVTVPSLRAAKCSIIKSNKEFFLEQGHYITKNYIYSG